MSGGRRHVGRSGVKQRDVRRGEEELQASHAARWDIVTRHAILIPGTTRVWLCRQSSGRRKPAYRSEQVADRVAMLLGLLDASKVLVPYRCHQERGLSRVGEHWHLFTRRTVLTPPVEGRKVSGVRESDTSPEEQAT